MSLLVQLELALHDADCTIHDGDFTGHGDKYAKLAKAALAILAPQPEPYWLRDMKQMIELTANKVCNIENGLENRGMLA